MKLLFDTHGNEKQKECCRAWADPVVTDIVYGGAKGGAKSFTGCKLIFHDALVLYHVRVSTLQAFIGLEMKFILQFIIYHRRQRCIAFRQPEIKSSDELKSKSGSSLHDLL